MIYATFTDEMVEILKSMIGEMFCSYDCESTCKRKPYGNFRINLGNFSVEFLNETKAFPFYKSVEDISSFTCEKQSTDKVFKSYCGEEFKTIPVNEKIMALSIINDKVSVNNGEYDICFDMAIVIETEAHKYVFSRGWFFGEVIDIAIDEDFDEVYPIDKVIEDWSNQGDNQVKVDRTIRKL